MVADVAHSFRVFNEYLIYSQALIARHLTYSLK